MPANDKEISTILEGVELLGFANQDAETRQRTASAKVGKPPASPAEEQLARSVTAKVGKDGPA